MMKLIDVFEAFLRTNRKIQSPHTALLYRLAIKQFGIAIGKDPTLDDLTDDALVAMEKFLAKRSPYTVNERVGRIKAIWKYAAKKGLIGIWPTLDCTPEPEPFKRAWHVDQMRALIATCRQQRGRIGVLQADKFWVAWHLLLWDTGERAGVMPKLRWEWLSSRGLDVPGDVRKDKKAAFYRLSKATQLTLESIRLPERELIFELPFHMATLYNRYTRILKQAGLPTDRKSKFQRIRRSHLTYWAIAGQDPTERAQHSSSDITKRHYLDSSLMDHPDPSTILPPIE